MSIKNQTMEKMNQHESKKWIKYGKRKLNQEQINDWNMKKWITKLEIENKRKPEH